MSNQPIGQPQAFPADMAAAVPTLAKALAMLGQRDHLVISTGGARYVQFAVFGPNLRGESVGNAYLDGENRLDEDELVWLAGHGWNDPDEGGNHWRHWEDPVDFTLAATAILVTLHTVHRAEHFGDLWFNSENPTVLTLLVGAQQ